MNKKRLGKYYILLFAVVTAVAAFVVFQIGQPEETADSEEQTLVEQQAEGEEAEQNQGQEAASPAEDNNTEKQEEVEETSSILSPDLDNLSIDEKVDQLLEKMTLEEKIGQMLVIGFQSTEVDEHVKQMIEEYHVGGIILYDRNMENPEQVAALNHELQQLAELPLIVSVDQEGGEIVRLRDHVSPIPSQQELGSEGDEEQVYEIANQSGKELQEMGFNVNYAPVLDLSARDSRSFGEDPERAFQLGRQVIQGLTDEAITPTVKHFPGNGRTDIDPHFESATVDADQFDLENKDIYPFRQTIDHVSHDDFFVMVTHFIYPAYDETYPASVSPAIITDLLRQELGYEGLVVTDDLEMGAVTDLYSFEELGYHSVRAGADLLLVCHTLESQQKVFNGIYEAVKSGDLSEEDIDTSVERILKFKFEKEL